MNPRRFAVYLSLASAVCVLTAGHSAAAQTVASGASGAGPHLVLVRLIDQPGSKPFAFDPANFLVRRGDTLRFVQAGGTLHDIHIKGVPRGAKLGGAATSEYLTAKGQSYTLVIDGRFVDGTYQVVCDPHESVGMKATFQVTGAAAVLDKAKP
jgi:plastocyanin